MPIRQGSQPTSHAGQPSVWTDPGSFATTLLTLFVDTYGTEAFKWLPETRLVEIQDDFHVALPQANFDRLETAIQIVTGEDFYKSLPDFVHFCNVLSGSSFDPTQWDPADAAEIAWGVTEAMILSPPDEDEPFTEEIRSYIGYMLDEEGIIQPPDLLRLALRGSDPAATVQGDFSDDPEMFSMIYHFEQGKTDDINTLVRKNLQALSQQLQKLPLRSGNAEEAVQRLTRAVAI
jgi:hypothetical protein